ncbi:hypothetical protein LTR10_019649 [Elasticomyces elasticus]|uniref:Zn(2)-C6 fungal-type domain-containing protein n=1 Tax=Exophiala sideris TaxID=1016849 RepID=A0ABR0JFS7_9EURO|nr:hypothetical protein LTR10_019649 [Elasticomyces elasticus]KAK5025775.1 hypothetical protein LTS07_007979 [Exophiala sideris]KAK5033017.1 hypothetical protein LTR13_006982 [Exophiala sideris]KAK5063502.1 hypothetical protein LTR69_004208 [Exophiala sideris]KAK5180666.1 hypothetical protein LTR44_006980 [Eurotiomycetes sp. CCFEE 6388]
MPRDSRSRSGCAQCKKRRRKCGEERPSCAGCVRRGFKCEFAPPKLRWTQSKTVTTGDVSNLQPWRSDCTWWTALAADCKNQESVAQYVTPLDVEIEAVGRCDGKFGQPVFGVNDHALSTWNLSSKTFPSQTDSEPAVVDIGPTATQKSSPTSTVPPHSEAVDTVQGDVDQTESQVVGTPTTYSPGTQWSPGTTIDDTVIGPHEEEDDGFSEDGTCWQFDNPSLGDFMEPLFDDPGEHIAFMYYFKHLAGVISARDDNQNPYRKLSAFALGSPVLLHTLISIATEWMFNYGRSNADLADARQSKALKSIQKVLGTLEDGRSGVNGEVVPTSHALKASREAVVSAILMQIAHVVFSGGTGAEAHLRCSYYLLNELGYISQPCSTFLPRILTQRFAMADVAASLLHTKRPKAPLTFTLYQINEDLDFTEPSFCGMTGCPQPVLSAFAHIAHLACDLRENRQGIDQVCPEAERLEFALRSWSHRRFPNMFCLDPERYLSDLRYDRERDRSPSRNASQYHLALLNECYYWLAHVLLQRRIYRDAVSSPRVKQMVQRVLALMKAIPPNEGSASSLPLPFYLVARECMSEEDRNWIRERHRLMKEVYRSSTREYLMMVTEEIWRNGDLYRQKCRSGWTEPEPSSYHDELILSQHTQIIF